MHDARRSISEYGSEFKRRLVAAPMPLQFFVVLGLFMSLGWTLYRIWAQPDAGLDLIGAWIFSFVVTVVWYYWLLLPHYILYLLTTFLAIIPLVVSLVLRLGRSSIEAETWTAGWETDAIGLLLLASLLHKRTRHFVDPSQRSEVREEGG